MKTDAKRCFKCLPNDCQVEKNVFKFCWEKPNVIFDLLKDNIITSKFILIVLEKTRNLFVHKTNKELKFNFCRSLKKNDQNKLPQQLFCCRTILCSYSFLE